MSQTHKVSGVATSIRTESGRTKVRYHNTDVVEFDPAARKVILNSGGWRTATTRTRIAQACNQFDLGWKVIQENFDWFAWNWKTGEKVPFEDCMELSY